VRPGLVLEVSLLLALATLVWFVFTARSIELTVDPEPDRITVRGTLPTLHFGGRYLVRPGDYTVTAERQGYRRLQAPLQVTRQSDQEFHFELEQMPGLLVVTTESVEGAEVLVDGISAGLTPLRDIELAAGGHGILVRKERYQDFLAEVAIEGPGSVQTLAVEMVPDWAEVTFRSQPAGATVKVAGEAVGRTPITAEVIAGNHSLEVLLEGYKPHVDRLRVVANEPLTHTTVVLHPAEGNLSLASDPAQATVTVDGVYRGTTPIDLDLAPNEEHELEVSKAGHLGHVERIRVRSGESRQLAVTLQPMRGEIAVSSRPPGAEIIVDGETFGSTDQTLTLPAAEHVIEVRKDGYEPYSTQVQPRPGLPQEIEVTLQPLATPELTDEIQSPQDVPMKLIPPGRFVMGASRREPGRRANETLREVELTSPFYLAVREVSNREFREFNAQHRSGSAGRHSLETDHHPVVRVTWEEAARYCNWLSERQGLPPVYVQRGDTLVARSPLPTGYRLPTEAEWAWAARATSGTSTLKYSWGEGLPIPKGNDNYGDRSAASLLGDSLNDYDDGHPVTAPAGSFQPNPRGLFNIGGNVSEWVNDIYTIYPPNTESVVRDPKGPSEGEYHVIRGASWMDESVSELRLSYRDYGRDPRPDVGFRIARSAE
jgi:formylglycine-generating enzyme required for sulfatase activity